MTKNELKKLILKWKPILKLQDWDITVAIVDQSYIDEITQQEEIPYKADALNKISSMKKACEILISSTPSEDIEKCLVHELVHVVVNSMDEEHRYAINCISDITLQNYCNNRRVGPLEQVVNDVTRICINSIGASKCK